MSGLGLSHLFAALAGVHACLALIAIRQRRYGDVPMTVLGAMAFVAVMVLYAGAGL